LGRQRALNERRTTDNEQLTKKTLNSIGAGGKMGCRITINVKDSDWRVHYLETQAAGVERMHDCGVSCSDASEALQIENQLCSVRKKPAAFCLSLLARNERGESRREGKLIKDPPLPGPLLLFEEERERESGYALKANLLPNTTD